MALAKDVSKAVAFLQRFELGHQPPLWHMPTMLSAEQLGIDADDLETRAPAHLFSHEAVVLYLVDQGDFYEVVEEHDMDAADIDFPELHQIGVDNLTRMVPQLRISDRSGVLTLQGLSMFEASMLLCTPLWESDEFVTRFGGDGPVVAIPSRDTMAICGLGDRDGLRRMRLVREAAWPTFDPELRLCQDLYARTDDGRWLPFESDYSRHDDPRDQQPASTSTESATPPGPGHLIADLPAEQRTPLNPTPSGDVLDPLTPVEAVGGTPFSVPSFALGPLDSIHYELLFASGYRFDSDTGAFVRAFVGEPGAVPDPWTLPAWTQGGTSASGTEPRKRRRFRRSKD